MLRYVCVCVFVYCVKHHTQKSPWFHKLSCSLGLGWYICTQFGAMGLIFKATAPPPATQTDEHEVEIKSLNMSGDEHVDASHFDLLKLLGQGSFGKVSEHFTFHEHS